MHVYIFVQLCFLVSQNRSSAAGGRRTKILQRRRHRRRMGCNAAAEKRPQSPSSPPMPFLLGREREVESICTHPRIHYNPIYCAVSHSPASSAELSHFRWRGRGKITSLISSLSPSSRAKSGSASLSLSPRTSRN